MSGFEPLHDAHAIEQVAIAMQFSVPLDDTAFSEVLVLADEVKNDLPRPTDFSGFPLMFPGQLALPAGSTPPIPLSFAPRSVPMGRSFAKFRSDGSLESEFRVDRSTLSYRTTAYSTWREVWKTAKHYFDGLIPLFGTSSTVSISLNYLDKFRWTGDPSNVRIRSLLRSGSPYVTPHVFTLDDMWHSHTGAFVRVDDATKRLMNVNVDYIDDISSGVVLRTIAIATILTDMFNQPGYVSKAVTASQLAAFFESKLSELHKASKAIFGQVIDDDMCQRIALNPGN